MFWDYASGVYDIFITLGNKRVNDKLCRRVAELIAQDDEVLECACGTGMLSEHIARKCRALTATDFSRGMLRRALKKCRRFDNVNVEFADITNLKYASDSFDKVVAGNVIHLLSDPVLALKELKRVCRPCGSIIIPTYVNTAAAGGKKSFAINLTERLGVDFKREFDYQSYQEFFRDKGCDECEFELVEGKTPCAVAVIKNKKQLTATAVDAGLKIK